MKRNQQGFTYPLFLCLLVLFLAFFSLQLAQLESERLLVNEKKMVLQEEYYFLTSVKKMETLFVTQGTLPASGALEYQKAVMSYQTDPPSGYSQRVNFTLRLNSGASVIGKGYFDTRTKKLTKWIEVN